MKRKSFPLTCPKSKKIKTMENEKTPLSDTNKRENFIQWEEYFMLSARLAAERSKDPHTQVGSVIVGVNNRILGTGYNGLCNGVSNDIGLWGKHSNNPLENKYLYVCHAELNAILNCDRVPRKCVLYSTLYPCNDCSKAIIQSGIRRVVYANEPDWTKATYKASKMMFEMSGIDVCKYTGRNEIKLNI